MTTLTKATVHVEVWESHNHLAGKPDGARMSFRSYLVDDGDRSRTSVCSHTLGHRSRDAARACGDRRFHALPSGLDPDETTAGGLPR